MTGTKLTITFEALKNEVLRLAAEHPDAVYPRKSHVVGLARSCFYTRGECGGGVGCIFGQALVSLDPSLHDTLKEVDDDPLSAAGINWVLEKLGVSLSTDEKEWCCRVQGSQDIGACWGEAVKVN